MQTTQPKDIFCSPLPSTGSASPSNQGEERTAIGEVPKINWPATDAEPTSYDEIPYTNMPHCHTHPRRLEAIATLFGMHPTPLPQCRVLELGSASGWNIIPLAVDYPNSVCRGIDLSEKQISRGQSMIQSMNLKNIDLSQANIMDLDSSWGKFDYIICHGIFSWVPQEVRAKIMSICKENLAPNGVAYVSYNVLPGWKQRGTIRDMMLYHANQTDKPREKISRARAVVDFMIEHCPENTPYKNMLLEEQKLIQKSNDEYLFHDHLEEHNHPLYFYQFLEQATQVEMQYLGDVHLSTMLPQSLGKKVSEALAKAPLEKQEQYMDFLRNRMFRGTLLCHANVPLNRSLQASRMGEFYLSLRSKPGDDSVESFQDGTTRLTLSQGGVATKTKLGRATIETLVKSWPRGITVDDIYNNYLEKGEDVSPVRKEDAFQSIASGLMDVFASGLLDIAVHPPIVVNGISNQPVVNPWARRLAEQGLTVTDQNHRATALDDLSRFIAMRLDGRNDRAMLIESVLMAIDDGRITINKSENLPFEEVVPQWVDVALEHLCKNALLSA